MIVPAVSGVRAFDVPITRLEEKQSSDDNFACVALNAALVSTKHRNKTLVKG